MDGRQLELGSPGRRSRAAARRREGRRCLEEKSQSGRLKEGVGKPVFAAGKDTYADIVPL